MEHVALREFGTRLLTRKQGEAARRALHARLATPAAPVLVIDFAGVEVLTPSFADECLGRLLLDIGSKVFRSRIRLQSADETMQRLVNHVLVTRAAAREHRVSG